MKGHSCLTGHSPCCGSSGQPPPPLLPFILKKRLFTPLISRLILFAKLYPQDMLNFSVYLQPMKNLRDDIMLSRLMQISLIGTLLLVVSLLLLEPFLTTEAYSTYVLNAGQVEVQEDSLAAPQRNEWVQQSLEWLHQHVLQPIRHW
jgi:hypothetical protein